jgi:RsiW-degrading membrane proteinase PrsW (M82 family)
MYHIGYWKQYFEERETMQLVVWLFFSGVEQLLFYVFLLMYFYFLMPENKRLNIDTIKLLRSLINTQMNVGTNQVTRSRKHT